MFYKRGKDEQRVARILFLETENLRKKGGSTSVTVGSTFSPQFVNTGGSLCLTSKEGGRVQTYKLGNVDGF